jgi:hypothetical protein
MLSAHKLTRFPVNKDKKPNNERTRKRSNGKGREQVRKSVKKRGESTNPSLRLAAAGKEKKEYMRCGKTATK